MRVFLITIQAALLTVVAVIGAHGESKTSSVCAQPIVATAPADISLSLAGCEKATMDTVSQITELQL